MNRPSLKRREILEGVVARGSKEITALQGCCVLVDDETHVLFHDADWRNQFQSLNMISGSVAKGKDLLLPATASSFTCDPFPRDQTNEKTR